MAGSHSWPRRLEERRPVLGGLRLAHVRAVRAPRHAAARPERLQQAGMARMTPTPNCASGVIVARLSGSTSTSPCPAGRA